MRISRLLVANRGEIALRIIRACRELGIETVAVCSSIDTEAPHARAADQAVVIGPPHPRDSYLSIGGVIDAARTTAADAVHPGYGFLSESPEDQAGHGYPELARRKIRVQLVEHALTRHRGAAPAAAASVHRGAAPVRCTAPVRGVAAPRKAGFLTKKVAKPQWGLMARCSIGK